MDYSSLHDIYSAFLKYPHSFTDTRQVIKNGIFFALKGDHFDGNKFASDALEQGAAFAVVDDESRAINERIFYVADVLKTLQQLAKWHRKKMPAQILAITGSNGKTTTKELIAAVLSTQKKLIFTEGNYNNHIGVPLTLLRIKEDTEIAIVEMGANHINEIAQYCDWAIPDFGIINNVGKAHLEGFGGIEGVKQAKGELYQSVIDHQGTIFRNADLPYLTDMLHRQSVNQITYGSENGHVRGHSLPGNMMLQVAIESPDNLAGIYETQLVGDYNLPNVLCAITVGDYFGITKKNIQKSLKQYSPENHRSQLIYKDSNTIILDAYNANPSSMKLAIDNIHKQANSNTWLLLGSMKELGENSEKEHQYIVDYLIKLNEKNVILVGDEYENVHKQYPLFSNSTLLADYLSQHKIENALILIKGSRGAKMENVMVAFE